MKSTFLAALVLGCFAAGDARADDKAAAEALFGDAKKLEKTGDIAGACRLFEASYHADPQLGVLLNMANCHEALGRTGTAWAEFREGIEMAARKSDPRVDFARRRATALEPRLVRLHVDAATTPGLVVKRDDTDISALVATDVVVDPGTFTIAASAPGHRAWSTTVDVHREGSVETVTVPALEQAPEIIAARPAARISTTIRRDSSPLRTWAFITGGVGLAIAGTGVGIGAYAWSEWKDTRDASVCDSSNICSAEGKSKIASSRSHARTSTYLVAAGGATVVASVVMLWIAPKPTENTIVTPTFDEHGSGVSLSGSF
ncbi:MAG TPA: hypothetical protein VGM90_38900 [Kofleriaceae bacterium]|jgi:hypothetical protein